MSPEKNEFTWLNISLFLSYVPFGTTMETIDEPFIAELSGSPFVPFEDSISDKASRHAVHCMVYADWGDEVLGFPAKAAVLMQMRFDGQLGFPGGVVDDSLIGCTTEVASKIVLQALARELFEEMNISEDADWISHKDYMFTHKGEFGYLHFYAFKVNISVIQEIENNSTQSKDFPEEVLGIFRVPLYTMNDGYRGLPAFLNNAFVGSSKGQLLASLYSRRIISKNDVEQAITSSKNHASKNE